MTMQSASRRQRRREHMIVIRITAHRLDRGQVGDDARERRQLGEELVDGPGSMPVSRHQLRLAQASGKSPPGCGRDRQSANSPRLASSRTCFVGPAVRNALTRTEVSTTDGEALRHTRGEPRRRSRGSPAPGPRSASPPARAVGRTEALACSILCQAASRSAALTGFSRMPPSTASASSVSPARTLSASRSSRGRVISPRSSHSDQRHRPSL